MKIYRPIAPELLPLRGELLIGDDEGEWVYLRPWAPGPDGMNHGPAHRLKKMYLEVGMARRTSCGEVSEIRRVGNIDMATTEAGSVHGVWPGQHVEFRRNGLLVGIGSVWYSLKEVASVRVGSGEVELGDAAHAFTIEWKEGRVG